MDDPRLALLAMTMLSLGLIAVATVAPGTRLYRPQLRRALGIPVADHAEGPLFIAQCFWAAGMSWCGLAFLGDQPWLA